LVKATIAALGEMRSPAQVAANRSVSVDQSVQRLIRVNPD